MPVPEAPYQNAISNVTNHSMYVTFDDGASFPSITSRQIAYNTVSYTPGNNTAYPTVSSDGSTTVSGLEPGTTYYVWCRCKNADGYSPWSNRRSIKTQDVPDPPPRPTVTNISPTSVSVTFSANGNGGSPIIGFDIGYGTDSSVPTTVITATSPQTIEGLTPGQTYYYRVRAENKWGVSLWSGSFGFKLSPGVNVYSDGVWKTAIPYVKDGGVWKLAQPWSRVSGDWKLTS